VTHVGERQALTRSGAASPGVRIPVASRVVPLAVPIFMNGGLTADFHNGLTISLRGHYVSDRAANESDTVTARGTT
jgi:hypothetical protein